MRYLKWCNFYYMIDKTSFRCREELYHYIKYKTEESEIVIKTEYLSDRKMFYISSLFNKYIPDLKYKFLTEYDKDGVFPRVSLILEKTNPVLVSAATGFIKLNKFTQLGMEVLDKISAKHGHELASLTALHRLGVFNPKSITLLEWMYRNDLSPTQIQLIPTKVPQYINGIDTSSHRRIKFESGLWYKPIVTYKTFGMTFMERLRKLSAEFFKP